MSGLWKKWWIRLILGIVMTPVVMTIAAIVAGIVFDVATLNFEGLSPGALFPRTSVLLAIAVVELIGTIPIWIGLEISNRRRHLPLPPEIVAAYLAAFAFIFVLIAQLSTRAAPFLSTGAIPAWAEAGVSYLVAIGLAILAVQPLIRRWLSKLRTQQDASLIF